MIGKGDLNMLEFQQEINQRMLNFLIGYLNEKEEIMGNNTLLKSNAMRSLYFPT